MSYANVSNNCTFIGRITKDIDTQTIGQGDKAFTKIRFTIACEKKMSKAQRDKAKGDSTIPTADFIPCECSGSTADTILKYFGKGKGIQVLTSYESYSWADKDSGQKKYGHRFNVVDFGFPPGNSNGGNGNNDNGDNSNNNAQNNNSKPTDEPIPIDDGDIPF